MNEYLRELPAIDVYDILCGLRGPDESNTTAQQLKAIITLRLRAIVFPAMPEMLLTGDHIKEVAAMAGTRVNSHFVSHLVGAVDASRTHPIWGGNAGELISMLSNIN